MELTNEYIPSLVVALDENKNAVKVSKAVKSKKYYCPICKGEVVCRAQNSKKMQPHFTHLDISEDILGVHKKDVEEGRKREKRTKFIDAIAGTVSEEQLRTKYVVYGEFFDVLVEKDEQVIKKIETLDYDDVVTLTRTLKHTNCMDKYELCRKWCKEKLVAMLEERYDCAITATNCTNRTYMFKISKAIEYGVICDEVKVVNKVTDGMFYTSQVYDAMDEVYAKVSEKYNSCKDVLDEFKKIKLPSEYVISNHIESWLCNSLYSKVSAYIECDDEWYEVYNGAITMNNIGNYVANVISRKEELENAKKIEAKLKQDKIDFENNIISKILKKYNYIEVDNTRNSYDIIIGHRIITYWDDELEDLTYEKVCGDIDRMYSSMSNLLSIIDDINNCKNKRWRCEYDGCSYRLYLRDMFYGNRYKDVTYNVIYGLTNTNDYDKIKEYFREAMISMLDDEYYRYDKTYVRFYLED